MTDDIMCDSSYQVHSTGAKGGNDPVKGSRYACAITRSSTESVIVTSEV